MNSVMILGNTVELIGDKVTVGQQAPFFELVTKDLIKVNLNYYKNSIKLISVIPSINIDVCAKQTCYFNQHTSNLKNVNLITISTDLPFAQKSWCTLNNLDELVMLSDYRNLSFGQAYGVILKKIHVLTRSIFVIDSNDKVVYVEYVNELTKHPNYEAALQAVNSAR
ncbi:thiol peroxidase [Bacillus sp. 196mf]|uniref:thiol peroxidase n=1 Tax=Bacillus sp. 196mf TaxID=1761754 RepID=UPI000D7CD5FE|nr:thiol peroxidase [Bacillus sp. 196mf]PYE88349.1 thiol peroxidase, atypical 2-Cys peroxiredoxin [Bacillus sp. 196mf]